MLGEHTNKILYDLGYNKSEIIKCRLGSTSTESLLKTKDQISKSKIFK
jgi:hypothetical protein